MISWLQRNRDLIALAFAGLSLLVLEFALRVPPITAMGIALAIWVALWFSLAPYKSKEKGNPANNPMKGSARDGDTSGHPSAADMQTVRQTLMALHELRDKLSVHGRSVSAAIDAILADAQAMVREAEAQPGEFRHDRRALLHYLPQVLALLEQSLEAGARHDQAARKRLEGTCQRLQELFASFRRRKAERQTRALNVQIDVLEAQLRQEGLAPPPDEVK